MLKRLWRRIVERNRRVNAELKQIELELAREESRFPLLPPFPQKPYKASPQTPHINLIPTLEGGQLDLP